MLFRSLHRLLLRGKGYHPLLSHTLAQIVLHLDSLLLLYLWTDQPRSEERRVGKDTMEATVDEVGPSISKGGVSSTNVGPFGSKYGKGGGDTLCLLGEGGGGG